MKVPVGKPALALLTAACIAVPAAMPTAVAAPSVSSPIEAAAATPAATDPTTLLELLTFPYHNIYGISVGIGTAANAGLQGLLLPVSIATLIAQNKADQVPAYTQTVQTNLNNAIPTIIKAIQAEIDYDRNLFSQFAASQASVNVVAKAATPAEAISVLASADPGATLLELLTFPYHNIYAVSLSVGAAANSLLALTLLPLSVGTLVATNKADQIPAYIATVQTNLNNAIPNIIKSIQDEIAYNQNLFSQFGATSQAASASTARVASTSSVNALAATDPTANLLQLLTFPYHNIYAVSLSVGAAANSVLALALLPLSVGTLVATNKTDQIPAYITTIQNNLNNAIPNIIKSIQDEIAYNQALFSQFSAPAATQLSESKIASAASIAKNQPALEGTTTVATVDEKPVTSGSGAIASTATTAENKLDTQEPASGTPTTPATKTPEPKTPEPTSTGTTKTSEPTSEPTSEKKPDAEDDTTGTGSGLNKTTGSTPSKKADTPAAQSAPESQSGAKTGNAGTADHGGESTT